MEPTRGAEAPHAEALREGAGEGLGVSTSAPWEQVVARTRLMLRSAGFRILSEMSVPPEIGSSTRRRHLFLSVWEELISADNLGGPGLDLGDHLPCNVVVFEEEARTWVAVLDPAEGLEGWERPGASLRAREALIRVLAEVASWPEGV
ncbi:MAG: hypothetical protein ACRDIF_04700 [Actinomycetota bacterium]